MPLTLLAKRIRRSIKALFAIGIMVNIGVWLERYVIIVGSTSHDFMPHNWAGYAPRPVEYAITLGSFSFFLFWFLLFRGLHGNSTDKMRQCPKTPNGQPHGLPFSVF